MREWTQTPGGTWHYIREGDTESYGYVLRLGRSGPRGTDLWAAILRGADLLHDATLMEGSLEAARRALEDHARAEERRRARAQTAGRRRADGDL